MRLVFVDAARVTGRRVVFADSAGTGMRLVFVDAARAWAVVSAALRSEELVGTGHTPTGDRALDFRPVPHMCWSSGAVAAPATTPGAPRQATRPAST
jgi:hypothetical protein